VEGSQLGPRRLTVEKQIQQFQANGVALDIESVCI
jgi:biotin operon repressor